MNPISGIKYNSISIFKWVVMFMLPVSSSPAQNLVPNYSFESSAGTLASPFPLYGAPPWQTITGQTTDIFEPPSNSTGYGMPDNWFGHQYPSHGNRYAGIRAWDDLWGPTTREYAGVQLTSPMIACQTYLVSFKVSRGNGPKTGWATDDLGAFISTGMPWGVDVLWWYTPQVRNPNGALITDSINWTTISGIYISQSGENYITIGNFETYDNTTVGDWEGHAGPAYYYIDEVVVQPTTNPTLNLGPDLYTCEGTPVVLDAGSSWSLVTWQDGSTGNQYTASTAGTYFATAQKGSCFYYDTLHVATQPAPVIDIGSDTTLCFGETLVLSEDEPGNYTWSNGETDQSIVASVQGEYWLQVDTGLCSVRDYMHVTYEDCIFIPDIFSPNNDGKNDVLYVRGAGERYFEFAIYDRWGQKVFETTDGSRGWDGTFRGKPLDTGVFIYAFSSVSPITNQPYKLKGNVTLMR